MGDISKSLQKIGAVDGAEGSHQPLVPKPAQGKKPAVVGKGAPAATAAGSDGSFVETAFADRTYWPDETVSSTDGVFTLILKPIKKVSLQGGGSIQFADPSP